MKWYEIVFSMFVLLGGMLTSYEMYKMTVLDAECRNLKHPKFWGLFSVGGNNSSGLLLYLIGRKKYPIDMNEIQRKEIESRKNKISAGLCVIAIGAIALLASLIFYR